MGRVDMEYTLIRAKRKSLSLQVKSDLTIVVRAPIGVSKLRIDEFVSSKKAWIEKALERQKERLMNHPKPTEEEIAALKQSAKDYILPATACYSKVMGLYPAAVKINKAHTRFGSCSSKNSLNFSCLLMGYPKEAVDYVIVHELAHIRHKNHGSEFYALIESILPDWKERAKLLKS